MANFGGAGSLHGVMTRGFLISDGVERDVRVYLCKGLPGSGDEVNTWSGGSALALGGGWLHVDAPL